MTLPVDLADPWTWLWIEAILLILLLISTPTSTWREYHAIMNLKRMRDAGVTLSPLASLMANYLLVRGLFLDLLMNTVHLTIQMRELPQWHRGEWLVTGRVSRLKFQGNERQRRIAEWYCGPAGLHLDDGDPSGCHCKA